jgi:hypothetical protein
MRDPVNGSRGRVTRETRRVTYVLTQGLAPANQFAGCTLEDVMKTDLFSSGPFGADYVVVLCLFLAPVQDTLFFAGEATDFNGHHGRYTGLDRLALRYCSRAKVLQVLLINSRWSGFKSTNSNP